MALQHAVELIRQGDIMPSPEVAEAAITMNRRLECEHDPCEARVKEAVMWLAVGRTNASRIAKVVDEQCELGKVGAARVSLWATAA